jgi:hypothetical protein
VQCHNGPRINKNKPNPHAAALSRAMYTANTAHNAFSLLPHSTNTWPMQRGGHVLQHARGRHTQHANMNPILSLLVAIEHAPRCVLLA